MPDLPTIAGGPGDTGSTPGSSTGVTLTANASNNTKATSYTTLIATTTYVSNWLLVQCGRSSAAASFLIDIAIGAASSEQIIINNLFHQIPAATTQYHAKSYLFPVRIPAGVRLSARCQSSTGSTTMDIAVQTISSPISAPPGMTLVETIGADTTNTRGTTLDTGATANTDVIAQLTAATTQPYRWMCLAVGNRTDEAWGGERNFLIDIVTGAGGSEVEVIGDLLCTGAANVDHPTPGAFSFPVAIANGARVAARARCSNNTAGDRVLDIIAYGVA